ncbi:FtsX-like permease family protein [Rhodoglobus sp. NPDC076762]
MNTAVIRLAVLGSRKSWGRLLGIIAGVAVGVALFLTLLGASGALQARDLRSGWVTPTGVYGTEIDRETALVSSNIDRHEGATINRLDIAATSDSTVTVPGFSTVPHAGEFFASPALVSRIEAAPADELSDRYGTLAGTLPDSVLKSPDSLVVVAGQSVEHLTKQSYTLQVSELTSELYGGNRNYQTVAVIGAIAILFPVMLLVNIVTGLGEAARRERFATLRLLGATPRTVVMLTVYETAATSLIGALLGVFLAWLTRPLAASLSVDGGAFFVADLAVAPLAIAGTVIVTVLASALVAARRIARAGIGPLGTTRQQRESAPRAYLLAPLALGIVAMVGTSATAQFFELGIRTDLLLITSFLLLAIGMIVAGPYLTLVAARMLAHRASGAATVIAANRIRTSPRATFRSVSGLVIAVFMVSLFAGAATAADEETELSSAPGLLSLNTVVAHGYADHDTISLNELDEIRGVLDVGLLYSTETSTVLSSRDAALFGITDAPSTPYLNFAGDLRANDIAERSVTASDVTSTEGLFIAAIVAETDGTSGAIERARTWMEIQGGFNNGHDAPGTRADAADTALLTMLNSFATLAYVGISIAILIAGVSLAVATVSSVLDRRRTLGLLRLTGMPAADMRRIVAFEAAVPLLAVIALSVALGFLTAWLVLTGLTDGRRTVGWPEPEYYVALGGSVALALVAVVATFGTIRRSTAISATRFE